MRFLKFRFDLATWSFASFLVVCCVPFCRAAPPMDVLPQDERLDSVPAPEAFFGFPVGSRHLRHDQVVDYVRELANTSDRVTILPYAKSHGQRPLLVAAITSAENAKRLRKIKKERARLTSGTLDEVNADEPLVLYMGYNVHGDEASAVNAVPIVAYHLASSQSERVNQWLDSSVFLVDPALNPDGLDRFANWANANRGRFPSDQSVDREHSQPWPGGRTNYYWFDLNRDWLPLVHPESRGRLRMFHQWKPNVVLDFHEMSGMSSYFFQPGISERNNPLTPKENFELTRRFAAQHARSMDKANELFFTEERFDDFYAGKGSTYPDLHGAIGILFEQGSTRGLRLKNERTDRTFADTVANQVRTSLSSLRAAGELKTELLEYQRQFYADALERGRADELTAYILTGEATRIAAAAELLKRHDVNRSILAEDVRLDGKTYPPRSVLVVPMAQAESTFVRSLMEPLQSFRENIFYDVSTWHLPSAMDLQMHPFANDLPEAWMEPNGLSEAASDNRDGHGEDDTDQTSFSKRKRVAGYAIDPVPLATPRVIARLHRIDAEVRVTTKPSEMGSEDAKTRWPEGTFVVLRQPNRQRWDRVLRILDTAAKREGVVAQPLDSSMMNQGPDLGSDTLLRIPTCKPLLVVGPGTSAYTAGALWHHLDVRMGQPTTLVDTGDFRGADLNEYTCVILPAGSFSPWGEAEANKIRRYVERGGTVVAIASAASWLNRRDLISIAADRDEKEENEPADESDESPDEPLRFGEAADRAALEKIAGAFFATRIDPTHPLAFGLPDAQVPVFRDHESRFPLPRNPYQTAARYEGVIAGYVSERNRERLKDTAAVWAAPLGRGRIILLADNPVFRGYVRSTERFFTNAVLLGPELKIPAAPVGASGKTAGGTSIPTLQENGL